MFWQLGVMLAAAIGGLLGVVVVKFRHAHQVFNRIIVRLDDPNYEPRVDEVARQRGRHKLAGPTFIPHPAHGHHRSRHH